MSVNSAEFTIIKSSFVVLVWTLAMGYSRAGVMSRWPCCLDFSTSKDGLHVRVAPLCFCPPVCVSVQFQAQFIDRSQSKQAYILHA